MILHWKSKNIGVYDKDWNLIKICPSYTEAAKLAGVRVQNVYKVCKGYKSTLNGYNFKIED